MAETIAVYKGGNFTYGHLFMSKKKINVAIIGLGF